MTDELQTSKLATSIAETLSPVPQVHGVRYGSPSQLYPLLLAPFFGLLSVPAAVDAAHALNAFLLASAAWPAYLLGRSVTRSAAGGLFAAALTAFTPWLVVSSTLLTENAAYPVFVWALFLAHRAIAAPSAGRDAAALAGLLVAYAARTQLSVLAAMVPVALIAHELAYGRADLRDAARRVFASHRLLFAAYAAGAVFAALLIAVRGLRGVFGTYQEAFRGDLFPRGVWRAAAEHIDYVAVGVGIAPFLLACAWSAATLVRPKRREEHAFAVILLVLLPVLTFQVASFNERFTAGGFVQDRYLFYLAPVLAIGAAAALLERDGRRLRAELVIAVGVLLCPLLFVASFSHGRVIFWASPASAFHGALTTAGGWVGLSADWLVRLAAVAMTAIVAAMVRRAPGLPALAATGVAVVAFGTLEAVYVSERAVLPVTTRPSQLTTVERDWIDDLVPVGTSVALLPTPYLSPNLWWELEFWNKSVDRVIEFGATTFTPFPADRLTVDVGHGGVSGLAGDLVVLADAESRLRFADATTIFALPPIALVQIRRPHRAAWVTRGAYADGWSRPGRPVTMRFFPVGAPGWRDVQVTVRAPNEPVPRLRVALRAGTASRRGLVRPGQALRVALPVCVPGGGFGDATLVSLRGARLPDGRVVGVHVDGIEAVPTGRACSRSDASG